MGTKNSKNNSYSGVLVTFSLFINVLLGIAFCYIYWVGRNKQSPDIALLEHCPACKATLDTIAVAQEMGRLDLISLLLAAFAIIIGIAALSWFGYVRREAKLEARDAIEELGEAIIHKWLGENPEFVSKVITEYMMAANGQKYRESTMTDDIGSDLAEQMASSIEDNEAQND